MQSIITLSLISFIPAIKSIECEDQCYSLSLDSVRFDTGNNAQCYTYSASISTDANCNAGSTPQILFGIDTNECYINADDLSSKITSTTPFVHTIKEDDSNIIGIEFNIDSNPIEICIQGIPTGSETTRGPLQITDTNNQCAFASDLMPNFCGICDGEEASTSCFCADQADECAANARPRGDLSCEWDTIRNRCIANEAPECNPAIATRPCVCFWDESECNAMSTEGGRSDCGWDDRRQLCSPTDCIDTFNCNCLKLEQDCESGEIIDFPQDCVWTIDEECIPFDGTTEFPESSTTTEPEVTRMPTKAPADRRTREPSISTTWQKPSKSWGNGGSGKGKGKGKGKKGKNGP